MSDLDLMIVHPGAAHGIYGLLGDNLVAVEPPMWARIIAGYVRDRGASVQIIDAEAERLGPEVVAELAARAKPRLLCLAVYGHQPSASTQQMHGAGLTAMAVKKIADIPIIMVGGHVSALPARTLAEESIDFACLGEGPVTVMGLLSHMPVAGIPGLVWRDSNGLITINPSAPLSNDLGSYHGDTWDLLPMAKYRAHNWQCFGDLGARQPYASIFTSLGCPWTCSFCCINAPFQANRYRMRKPEAVVAEIVKLYQVYGVKTLKIADEMFILNEQHYSAICRGIVAEMDSGALPRDLNIWAYSRVDTVNPANLALLKMAGVRWLALGIESASAYVRDGATKRMRNSDITAVVRSIQAAGINVIGNYIFGLPDDDESTMQETLDLAASLNTEFANFYCAMAYPGSKLYGEAVREGWTLPETWRGYSQHNDDCRPLDTKHVSAATVLRFRDKAFNRYFMGDTYREMVVNKFGGKTLQHVDRMTTYRLDRKLLRAAAE